VSWVIECDGEYWAGPSTTGMRWSGDILKVVRFDRFADAETVRIGLGLYASRSVEGPEGD
jgi:hypothetical protein